jgi:methylated-DNA-[protein]-cysteine S-methyltransferase
MAQSFHYNFPTVFGEFKLCWRKPDLVERIYLPNKERIQDSSFKTNEVVLSLSNKIKRYLAGDDVHFSIDRLNLDICSNFQRKVLEAEYNIPRGYVSTYGRIASYLGKEGGARAVGNALAKNPFPVVIPCHRAVRSDGSQGGYQGGLEMKRKLLLMEGVEFSGSKVKMNKVYY